MDTEEPGHRDETNHPEEPRRRERVTIQEPIDVVLPAVRPKGKDRYWLHILLFLLTYASCTFAGIQFVATTSIDTAAGLMENLGSGLLFSSLIMIFLTAHEFGHYFAARIHGVDVTLPYYIPMPFLNPFGTMGAVIRTRQAVPSRRAIFDIGVAGPLAGFVVAFSYLVIGMVTVPGQESLLAIHPEYHGLPKFPDYGLHFGGFLLFTILKAIIIAPERFFPGMNEIYHYPFLGVGWFGMFVTALNLIPVGQLDGGHIIYGMFGRRQEAISRWFMRFLIFCGTGTLVAYFYDYLAAPDAGGIHHILRSVFLEPLAWIEKHARWYLRGWIGWLIWYGIIRSFVRVKHPPTPDDTPLDTKRMVIGWIALAILLLTFSFTGIFEMMR